MQSLSWTRRDEKKPWATVIVTLTLERWGGTARLQYDVDHWSLQTGPQTQIVRLETTPCHFGGRRWWWICPATGRRCATLYLPNGGMRFLSRGPRAYKLAYASQRESETGRGHSRLARISRKLGAAYQGPCGVPPPRPKGMRTRTYERLVSEWEATENRLDVLFIAGAVKLLKRCKRL
jgi:hypothetical protein